MSKPKLSITIHKYSRWVSADGKRKFIVLGKWMKGLGDVTSYEVLEPEKEDMKIIPAEIWEQQIADGKIIRVYR